MKCSLFLAVVGMATMGHQAAGQGGFDPQGGEFAVAGVLPGDQVYSDMALSENGGYLVWQDQQTDGDGYGISAVRLDGAATSSFDPFRVNVAGAGNQEYPRIAALTGGNHLVVWQGGPDAKQFIYGRVIDADGLFVSGTDLRINSHQDSSKLSPAVAGLSNGNAIVVWGSFAQDDINSSSGVKRGLQGVYGQVVGPAGTLIGSEFLVNETKEFSQRTPAVASLGGEKFVVVWVTEEVVGSGDSQRVGAVDIMGRIYSNENATPVGGEFQINTGTNLCANPHVVSNSGGGFSVVWGERDIDDAESSWDIVTRSFASTDPTSGSGVSMVNQNTYGDQYVPRIAGSGSQQLVVWTSLGQDGSREGVYGRFLSSGQLVGDEFRVNTQTASRQSMPSVAAQNDSSMLVTWSSFVGGVGSVDLNAQRYSVTIPRPGAPIVTASSGYELFVGWPEIAGFDVAEYHLYIDGASEPVVTSDIFHRVTGLFPGTTHTVMLAYKLADGRVSPLSNPASGRTYGADLNFDGLPDDWQESMFGSNRNDWDGPLVDSDGDGVNNLNEFLAGTNANNSDSVLRMKISQTSQGWQLSWNSVPGLIYKVQASGDFDDWSEVSGYRFSAGAVDATFVGLGDGMEYYRVIRVR